MPAHKPKKRLSFLAGILLFVNYFAILLLLLSYLSVFINPSKFSLIAFAGLAYPVLLAINILFIILWIFIRAKYLILSLIVILIGWNHLGRFVQFNSNSEIEVNQDQIKILSYNIQNFVNVNTSSTKYITDFSNQDKIMNFLQEQDADIFCLQEVLNDKKGHQSFHKKLGKELNCDYSYHRNYYDNRDDKMDAIAIFSKFPIINNGFIDYDKKTIGIFADLIISDDTVRVYNLHLASIQFKREEYDFISDITKQQNQQDFKDNSLKVISRINSAYIKRGYQTEILTEHISKSPYPVFLCGDWNDTPVSFAYRNLSTNLTDSFRECGSGLGATFAGENFPSLRIDYILHYKGYKTIYYNRNKIPYSDHYPITAILVKQ